MTWAPSWARSGRAALSSARRSKSGGCCAVQWQTRCALLPLCGRVCW
jgi:hypothetical protein